MAIFASVVEKGSFTRAAEALGLTKSTISQQLRKLEDDLDVQLLNRSTRSLHLTDEGARLYGAGRSMLEIANHAFSDVSSRHEEPVGRIRLTAPHNLGVTFLDQCIVEFRRMYPGVDFDVALDDSIVAMIEEGFDLAIRVGWPRNSSLYARKLCDFEMLICGGGDYVRGHRRIDVPEDLLHHDWISIKQLGFGDSIALTNERGRRVQVKINTRVETNSGLAAREFISRGSGIGVLPGYAIQRDLASGAIVRVLPDWHIETATIFAVFPDRDHMTKRTRLFVDYLVEVAGRLSEVHNGAPADTTASDDRSGIDPHLP